MDNSVNEIEYKKYKKAKQHVDMLKGFYYHLLSYLGVILFLGILNFTIDQLKNPWFLWVALSWGIGLLVHALVTFDWLSPYLGKNWEERKIKEILEKEKVSEQKYK